MIKRLLLLICLASACFADPFQAEGRWRTYHTDGTPLIITLYKNHSARSDWENGTRGHWKLVEGHLVMRWKDGWRDVISLRKGASKSWVTRPAIETLPPPRTGLPLTS